MDNIRSDINNAMARIFCGSDEGIYIGGRLAFRESNGFVTLLRTECSVEVRIALWFKVQSPLGDPWRTAKQNIITHIITQMAEASPQYAMRYLMELAEKEDIQIEP